MAVNLGGLFQNINQASQFRKPASQLAQMPDNMLTRSGITNPLLQVFGQGIAGMTGTDLRTPEQIKAAQEQAKKNAEEQQRLEREQATETQILAQLDSNPLFTEQEKNMYTSMYKSGDINAQQMLAAINAKTATQQDKTRVSDIKTKLIGRGYDEAQLNLLDDNDVQEMFKSQVRQDMTQAKTVEGAKAYMEILDLPKDLQESASTFVNSDSWPKLSDAQRTDYFKRLENEKKVKEQTNFFRKQANSLPEGKVRDQFLTVVSDLEAGFVEPNRARDYLRSIQDPSITETDKVVMINGQYRKVVNKKVGNETTKVYYDSNSKKYESVPADALAKSTTVKPKQGFPSTGAQRLVKEVRLLDTSGVIAEYIGEPFEKGWIWDSGNPEYLDRQLEIESEAERLKQDGYDSKQILDGLRAYVNNKTAPATAPAPEQEANKTIYRDFQ